MFTSRERGGRDAGVKEGRVHTEGWGRGHCFGRAGRGPTHFSTHVAVVAFMVRDKSPL
jgi:hypothetical protein